MLYNAAEAEWLLLISVLESRGMYSSVVIYVATGEALLVQFFIFNVVYGYNIAENKQNGHFCASVVRVCVVIF